MELIHVYLKRFIPKCTLKIKGPNGFEYIVHCKLLKLEPNHIKKEYEIDIAFHEPVYNTMITLDKYWLYNKIYLHIACNNGEQTLYRVIRRYITMKPEDNENIMVYKLICRKEDEMKWN